MRVGVGVGAESPSAVGGAGAPVPVSPCCSDRELPRWWPCPPTGEFIIGRVIKAMNNSWHPGCFRCDLCQEVLADIGFVKNAGRWAFSPLGRRARVEEVPAPGRALSWGVGGAAGARVGGAGCPAGWPCSGPVSLKRSS